MLISRRYTIGRTSVATAIRDVATPVMLNHNLHDQISYTVARAFDAQNTLSRTATDAPSPSLRQLARQLASRGPLKTLPANKRIRILLNGAFIADTSDALYVWEHEFYPQYYLPMQSFVKPAGFDVTLNHGEAIKDDSGRIIAGGLELAVRRDGSDEQFRVVTEMVLFAEDLEGPAKMLRNYVKVVFGVIDQWFEEETPIYVHPRDPFKRIDTLLSSRPIRISLDGHILAESAFSIHLHETLLPTRYYIPYTSIRTIYLRPSETTSECPYKGIANYHSVVVDGTRHEDLVWWYRATTREAGMIEGLRCFYNEKVDIEIKDEDDNEWRRIERPASRLE